MSGTYESLVAGIHALRTSLLWANVRPDTSEVVIKVRSETDRHRLITALKHGTPPELVEAMLILAERGHVQWFGIHLRIEVVII